MIQKKIKCIPVIDDKHKIVDAVWRRDFFRNRSEIRDKLNIPVVIMAGGRGTRLYPFTQILPKPLIPVNEKPIIELIMNRFQEYGCSLFYFSVNYKASMIRAYFNDCGCKYNIKYIQEEKPLGTAGSLSLLNNKIKNTFFLNNCDIIIEADYADILKFHKKNNNIITVVASLKHFIIPYGTIRMSEGGIVNEIKEKPEHDYYVNTGMYILEPEVLKDIPKNNYYLMTDLIDKYLKTGKKVGTYPISDKSWIDIGQWAELQESLKKISKLGCSEQIDSRL